MSIEHLMAWVQAAAFVGTGLAVVFKVSAFTTRLELMIRSLAKRVKKLEKKARRTETR